MDIELKKKYSELSLFEKYLVISPVKRAIVDITGLVIVSFFSVYYQLFMLNWKISLPIGVVLAAVGHRIHDHAEKYHTHAHDTADEIKFIVRKGIYSKVRHPIYSGVFFCMIGLGLIPSSVLTLFAGCISSFCWVRTAWVEEKLLMASHGEDYTDYKKRVPYMFIPYVF